MYKYHMLRNQSTNHDINFFCGHYTHTTNLLQHKTIALFIWLPYHDTTTLHGNLVIFYLRPLMPWCGNRREEHPYWVYSSYDFTMCPSFPRIYLIIQISNFYSIPYFTMKHGNYGSCILSNLLKDSHNYTFLLQHHA